MGRPTRNVPPRPPRTRKRRGSPSHARRYGLLFLAVAFVLYLSMPLLVNYARLRARLSDELSAVTGRRVEMSRLQYSVRHRALVATDFIVAEDPAFGRVPFLQARSVYLDVPLLSLLFSNQPRLSSIRFEDPTIVVREDAKGDWNFSSMLAPGRKAAANAGTPRIEISGGNLGVETAGANSQLIALHRLELVIPALNLQDASSFVASADVVNRGTLKIDGNAGPAEWDQRQPAVPVHALLHLKDFDVSQWNAAGSSSLGGALSLDGSIESDGRLLQVDGQFRAAGLKLARYGAPATDEFQGVFTLQHDLRGRFGILNRCDFRVSKGTAGMSGRYVLGRDSLMLSLALAINGAPATELGPFLPALGFPYPSGSTVEGGIVVANLKFEGPAEGPIITGSLDVENTRLLRFDLSPRFAPVEGLNVGDIGPDVDVLSWKSALRTTGQGLALENLDVAIGGLGELTGNGTIGSDGRLNFTMSGIRGLTGPKGTPISFTIGGTCTDPIFRPASRK